jgi:hypothetical protein
MAALRATMPKATINKNSEPLFSEKEIRLSN